MHARALLKVSLIVAAAFVVGLFITSCGKGEKQPPAKTPQAAKELATQSDTADIFKEFYSEDSTKKKAAAHTKKNAKQQTFSPSSSSSGQTEFVKNGRYTVQISCVRSKAFADGMTAKLKDKGYPAYVAAVENPTPNLSGTLYRVRIGAFSGLSAAKAFGENVLVAGGYQYWIDKKSNDNVGMEGYGLGSGSAGTKAASSYDNAPVPSTTTYQSTPTPAATSSFESSGSGYSSPSSSSSSSYSTTGSSQTSYQAPQTSSSSASSATSTTPAAAPASGSTSSTPAPAASSPASAASPAAASAPAATSSGSSAASSSGSAGGKTSSSESGWGSDSSSKSGW